MSNEDGIRTVTGKDRFVDVSFKLFQYAKGHFKLLIWIAFRDSRDSIERSRQQRRHHDDSDYGSWRGSDDRSARREKRSRRPHYQSKRHGSRDAQVRYINLYLFVWVVK